MKARTLAVAILAPLVALTTAAVPATAAKAKLPTKVVVKDSRTSPPAVDISRVELESSWYWDSQHIVRVTVPGGFQPGHHMTVWFDVDGDARPEGRYDLRLKAPRKPGADMQDVQTLQRVNGWGTGKRLALSSCSAEYGPPQSGMKPGQKMSDISFDVFWCFTRKHPKNFQQAPWRVVVRVAKGKQSDMAPSRRQWSRPVAGWGPCDPDGGDC